MSPKTCWARVLWRVKTTLITICLLTCLSLTHIMTHLPLSTHLSVSIIICICERLFLWLLLQPVCAPVSSRVSLPLPVCQIVSVLSHLSACLSLAPLTLSSQTNMSALLLFPCDSSLPVSLSQRFMCPVPFWLLLGRGGKIPLGSQCPTLNNTQWVPGGSDRWKIF